MLIDDLSLQVDPDDYASLGTLSLSDGQSILIDTDAGITGDATFTSTVTVKSGSGVDSPPYRVFTFDSIDIASGATVTIAGETGLAVLSKSNLTVNDDLDFSGADGTPSAPDAQDGGLIALIAEGNLSVAGNVSAAGGNGASFMGTPGGDGGAGGFVTYAGHGVTIDGHTDVSGGDGGASMEDPDTGTSASGGDGGAAGASAAGTYAITAAAGTLSATNYTFTFEEGTLTVSAVNLDTWRQDHFTESELLDPDISGPTADADGLLEVVSVPYPFFVDGKKARFFRIEISNVEAGSPSRALAIGAIEAIKKAGNGLGFDARAVVADADYRPANSTETGVRSSCEASAVKRTCC